MFLKPTLLLWTQVASAGGLAPSSPEPPPVQVQTPSPQGEPTTVVPPKLVPAQEASAPGGSAKEAPPPPSPSAQDAAMGGKPGQTGASRPERLYSMTIQKKEVDDAIIQLCRAAKVPVEFLSPALELVPGSFTQVPLAKALELICSAGGLKFVEHDGMITIGMTMDLELRFPQSGEGDLDAVYTCRHLDPDYLATALSKVLSSKVKVSLGPRFKSPTIDAGNDPSGIIEVVSGRALNATAEQFKVDDIVLSGPADLVRRGIMLARKFDHARKQVRIDIRVSEIDDTFSQSLGVSWINGVGTSPLAMSATEQVPSSATGSLVPGLRLGTFAHTPVQVNAALNAL